MNKVHICLSRFKWYRKRKGGTWHYVTAYFEFRYWINRQPLFNEWVHETEIYK